MKPISTINAIKLDGTKVMRLVSFKNTKQGNKRAENLFKEWVKDQYKQWANSPCPSDTEIDRDAQNGWHTFEDNEEIVFLIEASTEQNHCTSE